MPRKKPNRDDAISVQISAHANEIRKLLKSVNVRSLQLKAARLGRVESDLEELDDAYRRARDENEGLKRKLALASQPKLMDDDSLLRYCGADLPDWIECTRRLNYIIDHMKLRERQLERHIEKLKELIPRDVPDEEHV